MLYTHRILNKKQKMVEKDLNKLFISYGELTKKKEVLKAKL